MGFEDGPAGVYGSDVVVLGRSTEVCGNFDVVRWGADVQMSVGVMLWG